MIDLQDMRDDLRKHTGTDEHDLPNDSCDLLLNRSYWEILDKFHFREKEVSGTFPTVAGTRAYGTPSPFEALRSLSILDTVTEHHIVLQRMTVQGYEESYDETTGEQGLPTHYVREGCGVKLWPTPDDVYTVTMKYWTVLEDLSDTNNEPPIPQSWHEVILLGGVWRAFLQFGDYVRGNAAKSHQKALVDSMVPVEAKEEYDSRYSGVTVLGRDYDV